MTIPWEVSSMRNALLIGLVSLFPTAVLGQKYEPPEWTVRLSTELQAGGVPLLVRALHNNRSSEGEANWVQMRYGPAGEQVGVLVTPETALDLHELLWLQDHGAVVAADIAVASTLIARVHADYRRTLTFVCEAECGDRGPFMEVAELSDPEADRLNMTLQAMAAELGVRRENAPAVTTPPPTPASDGPPVIGRITVNSAPHGTLIIDGEPLGETPVVQLALPIGEHEVRVEREGYDTVTDSVMVRATGTARRNYRLRRTDAQRILDDGGGQLDVTTSLPATVFVDNEELGESPLEGVALRSGVHALRIERPGYAAIVDTILVLGGTTLRRSYRLRESSVQPAPEPEPSPEPAASPAPPAPLDEPAEDSEASVTITATPDASVWVDGRHVGGTPIMGLRLPGGVHVFELVKDGYLPMADTVRVQAGARVRKMYTLERKEP